MWKGEIGDKMYISLCGRLGIYLGNTPEILAKNPIAILNPFAVVGDKALKYEGDVRSATVMCLDEEPTTCLTLTKEHYQKLFMRQAIYDKILAFDFLFKCVTELFSHWTKSKIMILNEFME